MTCSGFEFRVNEYVDGVLSARETWEMDRHLADCSACARSVAAIRRTVSALADAPRFEVSDDFMANLQARLSTVEPKPARTAWMSGLKEAFRPRLLPRWGAALATCGIAILLIVNQPIARVVPNQAPDSPTPVLTMSQALDDAHQHMALAASSPLEDISAANLSTSVRQDSEIE